MPLVRETTTEIGFYVPFIDGHVSLRHSHIHIGHYQILGIRLPLDCASDAIQIPEIQRDHRRGTDPLVVILYGIVFPVEGRTSIGRLHRKATGRT